MKSMIQFRPVDAALFIGGAIGVATTFINPVYTGASLAFMGGLIGGAALNSERNQKALKQEIEAERVSSCFSTLYDKNRGLIDPVELAFLSKCSVSQAHGFLSAIAEEAGGTKVSTKNGVGVVFNFPHSNSALDDLSKNASAWAVAQTKKLNEELEKHKRAIQMIQAQQAQAAASANARAQLARKPEQAEERDPWNGVAPGL